MISRKNIPLILFIVVIISASKLQSQTEVIEIWNGKVPDSFHNPEFKTVIDSDEFWTWTRGITNPTLEMYAAPVEKANETAVIICPGGGYWALAFKHEGSQIAAWFNELGITAFVLIYRLPDNSIMIDKSIGPMQDGQEAIRIVRRNAAKWNINPDKIGIMGFSAGGHLASTLSTRFDEKVYEPVDSVSARPNFSILIYPVISMDSSITHLGSRENLIGKNPSFETIKQFSNEIRANEKTPPAFLVHSIDDGAVSVMNSINYALALKKHYVPCELHIYEKGGHGYGLGRTEGTESSWPAACRKWMAANDLIK
ncbi:MAG: alpha/beta hydrolase [bacterium]